MKKVTILQKYLSPFRVPLFNLIARHPGIDLSVVYYGTAEARRKATVFPERGFREASCRTFSFKIGYEGNIDLPISLVGELMKQNPDITICAPDTGGIVSFHFSVGNRSKIIIWSEAIDATDCNIGFLKRSIRKEVYRRAWRFLVPGEKARNYIRTFRPEADFYYANNSIEEERFQVGEEDVRDKFQNEKLRVIFSGSLIERKGVTYLLEAFTRLMKENPSLKERCELRLLGTGPLDLSRYRGDNVHFEGFCEGETYADLLRSSHVFILPSLYDCNPLTVIEALFAGNIIVVTDKVGNHPEALKGNGILIGSHSYEEIYRALHILSSLDKEKMIEMATQSLRLAKDFSTPRSARAFIDAILYP